MAFSSLRCFRLENDVFHSLVGSWCNKHPWSSVPFCSYATSMKTRAVGPSLLAPPPEGGLLSFTSMRTCGSHRPPLRLRLFLYGPLFLLFVFVFFVSSIWVCLCCPSRRVLWSPCCSCWFFVGATHIPPKSNPRGGWGSSFSYFTFVVFFSCLRLFDVGVHIGVGVHTGLFCS